MVRYDKKDLIDLKKASIWKNWIMIALILIFGFVNVNAEQRCCFSTSSQMSSTSANTYKLNVTASHVDSKKGGNLYYVAISFQPGYSVIGDPYSPFSKVTCTLTSGAVPQYNCQSRDTKTFFIEFDLSIQPTPPPNSTITASSVFIFSDKCQNVAFCTDLAEKSESQDNDKISLGPLGTWPKYAVIIGGVILGITLLVACYLVYRRNRPDDSYRDRSITPGTGYNDKNRIFAPNSLLRNDGDDDSPPHNEPPKNTLIQFGNVSAHSPERSKSVKSVKNRNHQSTTTLSKSSTTKKKRDDDAIVDKIPSVIIDMTNNNNNNNNSNSNSNIGNNNLERSKSHKSRRSNNSKDNNNVNRLSGYSTSDMSKTISNNDISDRELSDNNNDELSSSNKNKYSTSTSLHRSKSKLRNSVEESRNDRRSSNNNHNNNNSHNNSSNSSRPHRRSTSKGVEEDRDGHKIDRTNSRRHRSHSGHRRSTSKGVEEDRDGRKIDRTNSRRHRSHSRNRYSTSKGIEEEDRDDHRSNSRRHRSHSRSRKNSSPPPPVSKSTSDLHKSLSTRTRQMDRDLTSKNKKSFSDDKEMGKNNRSSSNLDKKRSIKHKDLISNADTESTTSSSDIPLGDRLPLAMLVTKLPSSGQSNSRKPDKVIVEEDEDTTPLGRIGSFGATSTSSQSRLLSTDKSSNKQSLEDDTNDFYDSILNEVLGITDYQNTEDDKISDDDDNPIGKSLPNIIKFNKENDEEIPIGKLRSG